MNGPRRRVALTGATGFVGGHTAAALAAAGHEVRALVRDTGRLSRTADALGFDVPDAVVGTMTDRGAVEELLDGCDAVVHAAAVVSLDRRRAAAMVDENPRGTALVAGTAAAAGLDPIVCVSSVSALFRPGSRPIDQDSPVAEPVDGYARSKAAAEREARRLQAEGAPVVITYPGGILGPAAGAALGEASAGIAQFLGLGAIPVREGALSVVDVRDLAAVHVAALEPGRGPRRLICGGHPVSMDDLAATLESLTGRTVRVIPTPPEAVRLAGRAVDTVRRVVHVPGPLTGEGMTVLTQWPGTVDNAWPDTGVEPRPLEETIADSLRAWAEHGLLADRHLGRLPR